MEFFKFLRNSFKFHIGSRQWLVLLVMLFHRLENITYLYENHSGTFRKKETYCKIQGYMQTGTRKESVRRWGLTLCSNFFVCFLYCTFPSNWPFVDTMPYVSSTIVFFSLFSSVFCFLHWSNNSDRTGQKWWLSWMFLSMQRQVQ